MSKRHGGPSVVREDTRIPRPVVDVEITDDGLIDFFEELTRNKGIKSKPLVQLFKARATLSPRVRLAANLKNLLGCLAQNGSVKNVLETGLASAEERALLELEDASISMSSLAIAHALLNIRDRQELAPILSKSFQTQPTRGFIEIIE